MLLLIKSIDEAINLLSDVLTTLTEADFSISLGKCSFLTTEVKYLGRVISHSQVRSSPRKIDALINTPNPSNVKQVLKFLGFSGILSALYQRLRNKNCNYLSSYKKR